MCSDNSLYTGITINLEKRFKDHEDGKGSKYVRARLPFKHIYTEELRNRSEATRRELEIKKWSRERKIKKLGLKIN